MPTSTTNITGLRASVRGSSLRSASSAARRAIGAVEQRPGAGRAAAHLRRPRRGSRVARCQCSASWSWCRPHSERCSTIGPSARAGKNVRPATMTIAPATSAPYSGESVGNVPAVTGTSLLANERTADRQRGDDEEEATHQHRQALRHGVPVGVRCPGRRTPSRCCWRPRRSCRAPPTGRAVRGSGAWTRPSRSPPRRPRTRATPAASRSGRARRASSRRPGSSCRGTPACARPSGRR